MSVSSISYSGSFMQQQQQQRETGLLDSSGSINQLGSFASIDLARACPGVEQSNCNKNGVVAHDNHGVSNNNNANHRADLSITELLQQQQQRHQYAKRANLIDRDHDHDDDDDETRNLPLGPALPLEYALNEQRQECELMLNGSGFQDGLGSGRLLGASDTDELIAIASSNNGGGSSSSNKAAVRQHRSSVELEALNKSGLVNRANHHSPGPLIGVIDHLYHHDYQLGLAAAAAPGDHLDQLRMTKQHSPLQPDIHQYGSDLQAAPPQLNSINYRSSSPSDDRTASSWQMTLGRGVPFNEQT